MNDDYTERDKQYSENLEERTGEHTDFSVKTSSTETVPFSETKRTYTLEEADHKREKNLIGKMLDKLKPNNQENITPVYDRSKEQQQKLQEAGINLEKVPEPLKQLYVKAVNLVQNPEKRFRDHRKGLENLIGGLEGIKVDIDSLMYGKGYEPIKTEPQGLYGELLSLEEKRYEHAHAIKELEKEIATTYQRITRTKDLSRAETVPEKKRELNKGLVGFSKDLTMYEETKRSLGRDLLSFDTSMKDTKRRVEDLKTLREYVLDQLDCAKEIASDHPEIQETFKHTALIADLIPKMDQAIRGYTKMSEAFRDHAHEQRTYAAQLTDRQLPIRKERVDKADPLEPNKQYREQRDEKVTELAKKILEQQEDIFPIG